MLINQMIIDGYLYKTADKYSVIRLGIIESLKDPNTRVLIRTHKDKEPEHQTIKQNKRSTDTLTKAGYELFDVLRKLRLTIAREEGMPPYIIFSDKTLVDMSAKVPCDRESMLSVSGVGVAKYEKYGSRFIDAINEFLDTDPNVITSIVDEESDVKEIVKSGSKRNRKKRPFFLNREDCDEFTYKDLCLLTEIKDELNRIKSADNVKHIFGTDIFRFLMQQGYVEERRIDGRSVQIQTESGLSKGIVAVEKTSKAGNVYTVLMYPQAVQKEIVEYYTGMIEKVESGTEDEPCDLDKKSFEKETAPKLSRPNGAGASWSKEEDAQLDEEFKSGMGVSEIAKVHDRTVGAIRSRLKRHGLVG